MLEKLKELLGEAFNEDVSGKVAELLKTDYVTKADHDTQLATLADTQGQLKTANETIAGYEGMNIEDIQKLAADWKQKAETAEKDAAEKIASMQFSAKLSKAIAVTNGKNEKAIMALLDLDKLRESKNQDSELAEQLTQAKKDADYLFAPATPAPHYAAGTGTASVNNTGPTIEDEMRSQLYGRAE